LTQRHGLQVLVPEPAERELVHRVIYEELCVGKVLPASRVEYLRIIDRLIAAGGEAIILGCTEIALLVRPDDSTVRLFDTTSIHARSAAERALE
jgi:aspartate racemase